MWLIPTHIAPSRTWSREQWKDTIEVESRSKWDEECIPEGSTRRLPSKKSNSRGLALSQISCNGYFRSSLVAFPIIVDTLYYIIAWNRRGNLPEFALFFKSAEPPRVQHMSNLAPDCVEYDNRRQCTNWIWLDELLQGTFSLRGADCHLGVQQLVSSHRSELSAECTSQKFEFSTGCCYSYRQIWEIWLSTKISALPVSSCWTNTHACNIWKRGSRKIWPSMPLMYVLDWQHALPPSIGSQVLGSLRFRWTVKGRLQCNPGVFKY